MSYCIIDSTGAANDFATSQGIVDLEAIAGPELEGFLERGEADAEQAKAIVKEVEGDDQTSYIADLFGGTAPFVLSNGIEDEPDEKGAKYSDDQPRDDHGRWTDAGGGGEGGGGGGGADASSAAASIYAGAMSGEGGITQAIKNAIGNNGGEVHGLEHRIKTEDSLARKIASDAKAKGISEEEAAAQINDALRYTGVFTSDKFGTGAERTLNDLRAAGYQVDRVKNFWGSDTYKGTNVKMRSPDGQVFELQFHTPASFNLKGESHALYEKLRTTTSSPTERAKYGAKLTHLWSAIMSPMNWAAVKARL